MALPREKSLFTAPAPKATRHRSLVPSHRIKTRAAAKHTIAVSLELPFDTQSCTGPMVSALRDLSPALLVSALKERIEQEIGLLPETYHLSYLDAAPMEEDKSLRDLDVIDGAVLRVKTWRIWAEIVRTSYLSQIEDCLAALRGIKDDSWRNHAAWCSLYTAVHRGLCMFVNRILQEPKWTVPVNAQSPSGWTLLHVAARKGQWKVLCVLLDQGGDVRIMDKRRMSAYDIARKFGEKKCQMSLNFCQWSLQKHKITEERRDDYDAIKYRRSAVRQAHQFRDSTLTTWLRGNHGQLYMVHTPNPISLGEVSRFEQSRSAKAKKAATTDSSEVEKKSPIPTVVITRASICAERPTSYQVPKPRSQEYDKHGAKLDFNYGWFDPLRSQQFIPSTYDVLRYSDPSSSFLRPRSILNPHGYQTKSHACTASLSLPHAIR